MPPDLRGLEAVSIPDDGQEHRCVCGHPGYRAWDGDGWLRRGRHVVTDDEGRTVSRCHSCDRELEASAWTTDLNMVRIYLSEARGMCTDELPLEQIDVVLGLALDKLDKLDAALRGET